jgi:uncharacterized protein
VILTEDMKRVVSEEGLGYVATVCPDGTPNLSPKETTAVRDDDHLVFCGIRSPRTVANLRKNPAIELNVVDPIVRVDRALPLTSPAYDIGLSEEEVRARWRGHYGLV